jgi:hypothetical protein
MPNEEMVKLASEMQQIIQAAKIGAAKVAEGFDIEIENRVNAAIAMERHPVQPAQPTAGSSR